MLDIDYANAVPQATPQCDLVYARRFPLPNALVDMDFRRQRYWWGGAEKTTANFTTFNLNGSTIDRRGITPSATIDVTLSLAGLGSFVPGTYAAALFHTVPATQRIYFSMDDGTNNNRIQLVQPTTLAFAFTVGVGGVLQCAIAQLAVASNALNICHGGAFSYATNDFKASTNGLPSTPDTVGTVPAPTIIRVGKSTIASSEATATISRIVLYSGLLTQPELNALSTLIRFA